MKKQLLCLALAGILLPGCYLHQAYYVSPYNGNNDHYHTMPLVSDSLKSATYAGGGFYTGSANKDGRDYVFSFEGNISRSHHFSMFQAYYSANFSIGNYQVGAVDSNNIENTVNPYYINAHTGNNFFGSGGLSGGINFVLPTGNGGEWRVIGVEASSHSEFGNYLKFRQTLPDNVATLVIRNKSFTTYGLYSEILFKENNGAFGLRIGFGNVLESNYNNTMIYDNESGSGLTYNYFNTAFAYTYNKFTGYMQINTGTKASGLKFGVNYYLGKIKPKEYINSYKENINRNKKFAY